jgi:hypothetical protein
MEKRVGMAIDLSIVDVASREGLTSRKRRRDMKEDEREMVD